MTKLGTAGETLRINSFGLTLELRFPDAALVVAAQAWLPPHQVAAVDAPVDLLLEISRAKRGPRQPYTLRVDSQPVTTAFREATILEALEDAMRDAIGQRAPQHLFVHAGVVEVDGVAIVLPGSSAAGKTTLVEALLRAGARYGSDEYAVFDQHGLVHAFPRRLSIRQGGHRRRRVAAETLVGAPEMPSPVPVGLLVLTEYQPSARWEPATLSPGQAAMGLLSHTLAARDRPADALPVLARAAATAIALAGPRGDATDCASYLFAMARQLAAAPPLPPSR